MTKPLDGQTVLILGGSGQMGSATAKDVIDLGASAILAGRNAAKLQAAVAKLGPAVSARASDLQSEADVSALIGSYAPDHVVVAVSAGAPASSIPETPVTDAQHAFGRFWVSYATLRAAAKLPSHGSVTLLSGSSARTAAPGLGVWGALHGSIEALARAATFELAPVRVNVVSPDGINLSPDRQLIPRQSTAADIGQAIAGLISNPAITGALLDVDAGERKGSWSGHSS